MRIIPARLVGLVGWLQDYRISQKNHEDLEEVAIWKYQIPVYDLALLHATGIDGRRFWAGSE